MSAALRSEFPVFERVSYLNAGSVGPTPRARRPRRRSRSCAPRATGRRAGNAQFERQVELASELRARAAELLGADARPRSR